MKRNILRRLAAQNGVSMLEVVVSMTITVTVLLASVTIVNRAVAQVGSASTEFAEQPTRMKTAGFEWVQSEVEYVRSLGFSRLSSAVLEPAQQSPVFTLDGSTGESYRDITALANGSGGSSLASGEQVLPSGYARARVTVGVESLDGCPTACQVGLLSIRVDLFIDSTDTVPAITATTSMVRR
jgi:hypothetical protein